MTCTPGKMDEFNTKQTITLHCTSLFLFGPLFHELRNNGHRLVIFAQSPQIIIDQRPLKSLKNQAVNK